MWLLEIEPAGPGVDRRTFECTDCKNLMIEVVEYRRVASLAD
jgi:hypothetical protein